MVPRKNTGTRVLYRSRGTCELFRPRRFERSTSVSSANDRALGHGQLAGRSDHMTRDPLPQRRAQVMPANPIVVAADTMYDDSRQPSLDRTAAESALRSTSASGSPVIEPMSAIHRSHSQAHAYAISPSHAIWKPLRCRAAGTRPSGDDPREQTPLERSLLASRSLFCSEIFGPAPRSLGRTCRDFPARSDISL